MGKTTDIFDELKKRLQESGAVFAMIAIEHLSELEAEYNESITSIYVDDQFIRDNIQNYIEFSVTDKYPTIKTIIIIATPSPEVEVKFNYNGKIHLLKIPPHYSDKSKINQNVKAITGQIFDANGYKTYPVVLPKKLLAVRSGLAKYGKNNIAYIPGMGSYLRLTAFGTDMACEYDSWQDMKLLERCSKCNACQKNCPTGAIRTDQFLIRAERCLTHFNEQLGPFPEWIDPGSLNRLIGCIRCQNVCPENKKTRSTVISKESFSNIETEIILKGPPFEELSENLQLKISNIGLQRYYRQLSRNIKVLIENN